MSRAMDRDRTERGARRAPERGRCARAVTGVSIDSRTLEPGDLFFAIKGESMTATIMSRAPSKPARRRPSCRASAADALAAFGPVFAVDDTLDAMERLGRRGARARRSAKIVAVTGSVGKTTAKEMLRAMLARLRRNARLGRFLQQSLGRAADARAHAGGRALRRLRDRHESCRRNYAAHAHGAAACGARDDDRPRPHRASRLDRSDRRREGRDLPRPRAGRRLRSSIATRRNSSGWPKRRSARRARLELRPRRERATPSSSSRGDRRRLARRGARSRPRIDVRPRRAGRAHGGKRARRAAGGGRAWRRRASLRRGARRLLAAEGQGRALLGRRRPTVRRPSSTKATTPIPPRCAPRWHCSARRRPGPNGRRIAVIGDMLELGPKAAAMHAELAADLSANNVDLLFGAGPAHARALRGGAGVDARRLDRAVERA